MLHGTHADEIGYIRRVFVKYFSRGYNIIPFAMKDDRNKIKKNITFFL